MDTRFGFTRMTVAEFKSWIATVPVARTVRFIQQHHTWMPAYAQFSGSNHFEVQRGMKNTHVGERGWSDIGQHFTIFPDGMIVTGRSLESSPACITGNNSHSICIENLGNFDSQRDVMRAEQKNAIVVATAALCKRFRVAVDTQGIVYHHWFRLDNGFRNDGAGNNKSCPGTAFFGGNKVQDCINHFLPLVSAEISGGQAKPIVNPKVGYGFVTATTLNIRSSASTSGAKIGSARYGAVLRLHAEQDGWFKISKSNEEWVYGMHLAPVQRATVKATTLNVRSGPGTSFAKTGALTQGQEVFIHETTNGWCRIAIEPQWVSQGFLQI